VEALRSHGQTPFHRGGLSSCMGRVGVGGVHQRTSSHKRAPSWQRRRPQGSRRGTWRAPRAVGGSAARVMKVSCVGWARQHQGTMLQNARYSVRGGGEEGFERGSECLPSLRPAPVAAADKRCDTCRVWPVRLSSPFELWFLASEGWTPGLTSVARVAVVHSLVHMRKGD